MDEPALSAIRDELKAIRKGQADAGRIVAGALGAIVVALVLILWRLAT